MNDQGYIIRWAGREDLPKIQRLFHETDFLSSGPSTPFNEGHFRFWLDRTRTIPLVAVPVTDRHKVVGFAQLSHKTSPSRAFRFDLEDVNVDPAHRGHKLGRRLMGALIWVVENLWHPTTRLEWVSEDTEKRQDARHMYQRIGAEIVPGTIAVFRLRLPYEPERYDMTEFFVEPGPA